jgi:VWFA-related protein
MSDGADNALTYYSRIGSKIGFAGLVDSVQKSSTAIFPIYLDTEGPDPDSKRLYADARRTLKYLADQSAGNMYMARKLDDLTAVYDRVLKDVGTVYTIGFSPDDESTNSKWRRLRVEVPSRPGLKLQHRPGYFTK